MFVLEFSFLPQRTSRSQRTGSWWEGWFPLNSRCEDQTYFPRGWWESWPEKKAFCSNLLYFTFFKVVRAQIYFKESQLVHIFTSCSCIQKKKKSRMFWIFLDYKSALCKKHTKRDQSSADKTHNANTLLKIHTCSLSLHLHLPKGSIWFWSGKRRGQQWRLSFVILQAKVKHRPVSSSPYLVNRILVCDIVHNTNHISLCEMDRKNVA